MCGNIFFYGPLLPDVSVHVLLWSWPVLQAAASMLDYPRDRTNPVIMYHFCCCSPPYEAYSKRARQVVEDLHHGIDLSLRQDSVYRQDRLLKI